MTIVLERRRFLLATRATGLVAHRAWVQRPYCQIQPAPVSCYAECKYDTVLSTSCNHSGNQCRSSCDVYQPGQRTAQVLDGLTWRSQEGSLQPTEGDKQQLRHAMDLARDALISFLANTKDSIKEPSFYLALFSASPHEPVPILRNTGRRDVSACPEAFAGSNWIHRNAPRHRGFP